MLLLLKPTAILALKNIFKVQTSAVTQWKASRISLEWAQLWNNSHDKHLSPQTCKEKQQPSVLIKGPYQNFFTFQSICFKHAGCSSSKLTNCYNSPLLILFKHFHTGTNSKNCWVQNQKSRSHIIWEELHPSSSDIRSLERSYQTAHSNM